MVLQTPSVLHTSIAHVAKPTAAGAHTHTQYIIRVSDERSPGLHWTVFRRYSEFRVLRLRLEEAIKAGDMCDHCSIMAKRSCFLQFPHRKWFGNLKESTLETRRVGLNAFLDAVAKHARTCKESVTCHTRPLMDQFLMVNDMRYSFLNVHMSEQEVEMYTKLASGQDDKLITTPRGAAAVPATNDNNRSSVTSMTSGRLDRLSGFESLDNVSANNQEPQPASGPSEDHQTERVSAIELEGRVLKAKLKTMPNLLAYGKDRSERKSRTQSWDNDVPAARPNSLSSWESVKYQTQSVGGRFSDPGAPGGMRNDLLSFSRGSFGGGSGAGGLRRSEQRARARKVHLSSAAKRVKKLEEQEARFHSQTVRREKQVARLAPIME